jgi:hypothetical protein
MLQSKIARIIGPAASARDDVTDLRRFVRTEWITTPPAPPPIPPQQVRPCPPPACIAGPQVRHVG